MLALTHVEHRKIHFTHTVNTWYELALTVFLAVQFRFNCNTSNGIESRANCAMYLHMGRSVSNHLINLCHNKWVQHWQQKQKFTDTFPLDYKGAKTGWKLRNIIKLLDIWKEEKVWVNNGRFKTFKFLFSSPNITSLFLWTATVINGLNLWICPFWSVRHYDIIYVTTLVTLVTLCTDSSWTLNNPFSCMEKWNCPHLVNVRYFIF